MTKASRKRRPGEEGGGGGDTVSGEEEMDGVTEIWEREKEKSEWPDYFYGRTTAQHRKREREGEAERKGVSLVLEVVGTITI